MPLVEARDLTCTFAADGWFRRRGKITAVGGIDLSIASGETVALVGESGCGKSTLGRLLLGLQMPTTGHVLFNGGDLSAISGSGNRRLRARMQLVFQNTLAALDPRMTIGEQIVEPLAIHELASSKARRALVAERLREVGLDAGLADRFPHQLSGGQRQRVVIARALVTQPDFVVFDEPVSALDVSIQAQIIALVRNLQRERGFASVFISHDLRVVRQVADRVAVMYLGRIVEQGPVARIFATPSHPYTRALVAAVPRLVPGKRVRERLTGEPPSPAAIPSGCAFHTRCPVAVPACGQQRPALRAIAADHAAACHLTTPYGAKPPALQPAHHS